MVIFKPQERVRYIGDAWPERKGWLGSIKYRLNGDAETSGYYQVIFDNHNSLVGVRGSSLERVNDEINNV